MEHFECHGQLHITLHEGIADATIAHQQSHKPYVSIDFSSDGRPVTFL